MQKPLTQIFATILCTIIVNVTNGATESTITIDNNESKFILETIDESKGFIQNSITDIIQDKEGFMWYSTPNGVYKFDGQSFSTYNNEYFDDAWIMDLEEIDEYNICFASKRSIYIYSKKEDSFKTIDISARVKKNSIRSVTFDSTGQDHIWVLTNVTLLLLEPHKGNDKSKHIYTNISQDLKINNIQNIYKNKAGCLWVVTDKRVLLIQRTENGVVTHYNKEIGEIKSHNTDNNGNLLLTTYKNEIITIKRDNDGSYKESIYNIKSGDGDKISLDNILSHNGTNIIINDFKRGIYSINLLTGVTQYHTINFDTPFDFRCTYIDRSGIIWYGSTLGGLFKVNMYRKPFWLTEEANPFISNQITGDNKGNVWAATYKNGVKHIQSNTGECIDNLNKQLNIPNNSSISGLCYINGYLWINNYDGSVIRAKLRDGHNVERVDIIAKLSIKHGFFSTAPKGQLYMGKIWEGIYWTPNPTASKPTFKILLDTNNKNPFDHIGITAILADKKGVLWVGTIKNGLYRVSTENGIITNVEQIDLFEESKEKPIFSICSHGENLLIATFGNGVISIPATYYNDKSQYQSYTTSDGLSDNSTYSVFSNNKYEFWVSTDNGITCYSAIKDDFKIYNHSDGMGNTNFRRWAAWQSDKGEIYYGGNKNITHFNPDKFLINRVNPDISITDLYVIGQRQNHYKYMYRSISDNDTSDKQSLTLPYNKNNLTFNFSAIHYDNPSYVEYKYKLKGGDNRWHKATSKNSSVTYTDVNPGVYTFMVRGCSRDGLWSNYYSCLNFEIKPHWSATILARTIYLLIFGCIVYLIMQYIYKDRIMRYEAKINRSRLDFFSNISHELKTPLTLISGILNKLSINGENILQGRDLEIVKHNSDRLLQLVSQLLNFRKTLDSHMPFTPTRGNIAELIETISKNIQVLASQKNITYKYNSTFSDLTMDYDSDKIDKILSNLLSNAIKYTNNGGIITLKLHKGIPSTTPKRILNIIDNATEENFITIAVTDNGIGISEENIKNIFDQFYQVDPKSTNGVGIGLAYAKMLVELHSGYIFVESKLNYGSTFYVLLPQTQNDTIEDNPTQQSERYEEDQKSNTTETLDIVELEEEHPDYSEKRLLIVEDNSDICELLKEIFQDNYVVHIAMDGVEGYDIATSIIPDIIISDVMMPRMDGIELCKALKANILTRSIPIIMLTAKSSIEHQISGIKEGAEAYIPKPFDIEYLKANVENIINTRETLKNRYISTTRQIDTTDDTTDDLTDVKIDISPASREFSIKLEAIIEANLQNGEFSVKELVDIMGYSQLQLYRKIKTCTGLSAVEFIRNYRLRRSIDMIKENISGEVRINDILYKVGFNTPSYYTKIFKAQYGKTPKEFIKELKESTNHTKNL